MNKFDYFFNDYISMKSAPPGFVTKVMTQLDALLYKPGSTIVKKNNVIDELVLISEGRCDLIGYFTDRKGRDKKILITHLPQGSWYGDF